VIHVTALKVANVPAVTNASVGPAVTVLVLARHEGHVNAPLVHATVARDAWDQAPAFVTSPVRASDGKQSRGYSEPINNVKKHHKLP